MNIDGKPLQFDVLRVQGVPAGKVAAVLDTGFSLAPIPPPAVDMIYSSIEGAVLDKTTNTWLVPCNSISVSLSFVFGCPPVSHFIRCPIPFIPWSWKLSGVRRLLSPQSHAP